MYLCPQSLKKKVEFLQKTLSTPTRTNEALSRLVFERCVSHPHNWSFHVLWLLFHENVNCVQFTHEVSLTLVQPSPIGAEAASPQPACRWRGHWPQHDLWHHHTRRCGQETGTGPVQEDATWPSGVGLMWLIVGMCVCVCILKNSILRIK